MSEPTHLKSTYEFHDHQDPNFPIIFHLNCISKDSQVQIPHWHKALELLYVTKGKISVVIDAFPVDAEEGELVVVNSSALHSFKSRADESKYFCLIADTKLCASFGLDGEKPLQPVFSSPKVKKYFTKINEELVNRESNYKAVVKAQALELIALLYRHNNFSESNETQHNPAQLVTVRNATAFISEHFNENITTTDVCSYVGFSKYYLCRIFKIITGFTVTEYLNKLRCEHARKLIATGDYNISESAELSGFQNLSYFSKTYKRYIGSLPSESLRYPS